MVTVTSYGTVGHQDSMSMIMDLPFWPISVADKYIHAPSKINIVIEDVKTHYIDECCMYILMTTVQ